MPIQLIDFTKISSTALLVFTALISSLALSTSGWASKGGETSDNTRVIVLTPEQLPSLKGGRLASFSLAAVSGGRMNPIPFQFDEKTESGYIYMPKLDEKLQKDDPILGTPGFFDEKDELLFMLKDAGPRRKNGMATDGKAIAEIEVLTYNNEKRYVYIVEDARLESETYYVRYSSELGRVETDYYALKVDPKNAFMWEEFYYDSFDGAHPRKPIDTIKIRMKGNALGGVPVELTNKNIVAKAIAEKSGPIRSTTQYKMTLTYIRTPLLNMKLQILHHEQEISYDAQTEIPPIRRRLVGKPSLKISVDGYDLQGASVRVKNGPKEPGIVDGEISAIEEEIRLAPVEAGIPHWIWLDSHYGFTLFSNFRIEGSADVPMEILFEDDTEEKDKSEYYKGQLPNVGFTIPKIPLEGSMRVIVDLKMYSEKLDMDVDTFANIVNKPPQVKVFKM